MKAFKSQDFYVHRVQNAAEQMLLALNHYTYGEAESVIEWLLVRLKEESVLKMTTRYKIQHDHSFPLRVPPKRRLIYSMPGVNNRKLPK